MGERGTSKTKAVVNVGERGALTDQISSRDSSVQQWRGSYILLATTDVIKLTDVVSHVVCVRGLILEQ